VPRLRSRTPRSHFVCSPHRPGEPKPRPRLRSAIGSVTASDLDGLDRVLDDALTAHIDALLGEAARTPLDALAERFPEVTADNLDEVMAALRALLEEAIAARPDGRVAQR
jgi:hypothetical protein